MTEAQPTSNNRVFRLRYSLRTLLIVITVLGVCIGYMSYEAKRQRKVVAELEKLGAEIEFFTDRKKPGWMPELLDTGYLGRIDYVYLGFTQVTDVSALREMKNLERLDLRSTSVSDMSALKALRNLEWLELGNTVVRDFSVLREFTNLKVLLLSGTDIRDLSVLRELTNLRILQLSNTQVDDVSVLRGLKKLEILDLYNTHVNDISALGELENLSMLSLYNTPISDEDIEKLKALLPKCDINHTKNTESQP